VVTSEGACSGVSVEGHGQLLHGLGMPKFSSNPTIGFAKASWKETRFSL